MKNKKYVELDLDSIEYTGDTDNEKKLNKMLLETTLQLNWFQDSYDSMKTVDEIKERLNNREEIVKGMKDSIDPNELASYEGEIKVLKWVLNGSHTVEEKESKLPKASKEDIERIIKNFNERLQNK